MEAVFVVRLKGFVHEEIGEMEEAFLVDFDMGWVQVCVPVKVAFFSGAEWDPGKLLDGD